MKRIHAPRGGAVDRVATPQRRPRTTSASRRLGPLAGVSAATPRVLEDLRRRPCQAGSRLRHGVADVEASASRSRLRARAPAAQRPATCAASCRRATVARRREAASACDRRCRRCTACAAGSSALNGTRRRRASVVEHLDVADFRARRAGCARSRRPRATAPTRVGQHADPRDAVDRRATATVVAPASSRDAAGARPPRPPRAARRRLPASPALRSQSLPLQESPALARRGLRLRNAPYCADEPSATVSAELARRAPWRHFDHAVAAPCQRSPPWRTDAAHGRTIRIVGWTMLYLFVFLKLPIVGRLLDRLVGDPPDHGHRRRPRRRRAEAPAPPAPAPAQAAAAAPGRPDLRRAARHAAPADPLGDGRGPRARAASVAFPPCQPPCSRTARSAVSSMTAGSSSSHLTRR